MTQPFTLISIYNGVKEGKIQMAASDMCVMSIRLHDCMSVHMCTGFFQECSLVLHTHTKCYEPDGAFF